MSRDFKKLKDLAEGSQKISSDNDAGWFLCAITKSSEDSERISMFTSSKGKIALKTALLLINFEKDTQLDKVIKFLEHMVGDQFSSGLFKTIAEDVYRIIYEIPKFFEMFRELLELNRIPPQAKPILACFIAHVSKLIVAAKENGDVLRIVQLLISEHPLVYTELRTLFFTQLNDVGATAVDLDAQPATASEYPTSGHTARTLHDLKELLPQHDNDFPLDFRKVSVFPTTNEMNTPVSLFRALSSRDNSSSSTAALMLDRHFRLLREDLLAPMRVELSALLDASPGPNKTRDRKMKFLLPRAVTVEVSNKLPFVVLQFEMPDNLFHRIRGACKTRREVEEFFSDGPGRKILAMDSVLLFLAEGRVVNMGSVCERNASLLSFDPRIYMVEKVGSTVKDTGKDNKHQKGGKQPEKSDVQDMKNPATAAAPPPKPVMSIGVTFFNEALSQVLAQLCGEPSPERRQNKGPIAELMVQMSASLFSYEPVLKCLQNMSEVPLTEELVDTHPSTTEVRDNYQFPGPIHASISRDPTQLAAAAFAMKHRVSVIQGPPGTGKTYIGVQIVRALLSEASRTGEAVRILCLCFTNHALDSFLEDLVKDAGVRLEDIVRLGSSPKMAEMFKSRVLRELEDEKFDQTQRRVFATNKQLQESESQNICNLAFQITDTQWGASSWDTVLEHLRNYSELPEARDIADQLEVPERLLVGSRDGMTTVGRKGKAVQHDDYWRVWCEGRPPPRDAAAARANTLDVWKLNRSQRFALIDMLHREYLQSDVEDLRQSMKTYSAASRRLAALRDESKLSALRGVSIIGCTTTSAAKFHDLLESVAPTVVLVEEAAEILESHVLTNINASTKQLIMIGDHLQLRPKLEHYPLRKESGQNINFDVSLFERLAKEGYPVTTLSVQHRMRPEISKYIRLMTYPDLVDHDSVKGREDIRGVTHNVAFIQHDVLETSEDDRAVLDTNSKVNMHEVDMAVSMVQYLLQQGYRHDEIVILTPYLGQLVKIQAAVKTLLSVDVDISDLDKSDVFKNAAELGNPDLTNDSSSDDGGLGPNAVKAPAANEKRNKSGGRFGDKKAHKTDDAPKKPAVRVATIDNYQGEEARIIIASLVRSNKVGDIGFMSGPERVNVLFSRARDGFFILGNPDTFRRARSAKGRAMWTKLLDEMEIDDCLLDGFPTRCHCHNSTRLIAFPKEFKEFCPNGGCDVVCDAVLPSCPLQHRCVQLCHNIDHSVVKCDVKVKTRCAKGLHDADRFCFLSTAVSKCVNPIRDSKCTEGHNLGTHRCCDPAPTACKTCAQLRANKEKEEEELAREVEKLNEKLSAAALDQASVETQLNLEKIKLEASQQINRRAKETQAMKSLLGITKNNRMTVEQQNNRAVASDNRVPPVVSAAGPADSNTESAAAVKPPRTRSRKRSKQAVDEKQTEDAGPAPSQQTRPTTSTPVPATVPVLVPATKAFASESLELDPAEGDSESDSEDGSGNSDVQVPQHSSPINSNTVAPRRTVPCNSGKLKRIVHAAFTDEWSDVVDIVLTLAPETDLCDSVSLAQLPSAIASLYLLANFQLGEDVSGIAPQAEVLVAELDSGATAPSSVDDDMDAPTQCAIIRYVGALLANERKDIYTAAALAEQVLQQQSTSATDSAFPLPSKWTDELNCFVETARKVKPPPVAEAPKVLPEDDWEAVKREKGVMPSKALDNVMQMTGLQSIKREMLTQYHAVDIARRRGTRGLSNYNSRFSGNPGTGKTTVARLYAKFLIEVGILAKDSVVEETTGSALKHGGVSAVKKTLDGLKDVGGGVIFVDEAYQLDDNQGGHAVLDFILTHSTQLDGDFGAVVWIFAGYTKRLDKLFEHNDGLPSRFPYKFVFEDYTDAELLLIFNGLLQRGGRDAAETAANGLSSVKPVKPAGNSTINISRGYGMSVTYNDVQDEWGNTWKWDNNNNTYVDPFDNISGYGPKGAYALGSASNPVVSRKNGVAWIFDRVSKEWYQQDDGSIRQSHYPGSVKPVPVLPPPKPFVVEDPKWSRVAMTRLGRMRNTVGFGNARAVRTVFDRTMARHAERLSQLPYREQEKQLFFLVRDDLLGVKASEEVLQTCAALKELQKMEGLKEVKESVRQLLELVIQNANREDEEKPLLDIALNRVFLGNPGTGKTTVAKLYARILSDFSLLSKGEVVLKFPSDFVGNVLGSSESQTRSILEAAAGSVLVIDEAYGLCPDNGIGGSKDIYKEAVITTLVEQVQGVPGEDRAVLLLGYRKDMEQLMANSNVGLARRFNLENAFVFSDYSDSELVRIMRKRVADDGLKISTPTAVMAVKILAKGRNLPNFGNAGAVNNLLTDAKLRMQIRYKGVSVAQRSEELLLSDFERPKSEVSIEDLFRDLVGCEEVHEKIMDIQSNLQQCKELGIDPTKRCAFNYVFTGSPGTGKTTVARLMGKIFYKYGLLSSEEVVETSPDEFSTGYLGQAGKKTQEMLKSARGKVLFIDEAYGLDTSTGHNYNSEVVTELVKSLTAPEFVGKMVVIMAGYKAEMESMLDSNAGLRSRFPERVHFDDFSPALVEQLIHKRLLKDNLVLSDLAEVYLRDVVVNKLRKAPNFANGRDVGSFCEKLFTAVGRRNFERSQGAELVLTVEVADLDRALAEFLKMKKSVPGPATLAITPPPTTPLLPMASAGGKPPPSNSISTTTASAPPSQSPPPPAMDLPAPAPEDRTYLSVLQDLLDARGLNSQEGVRHLSTLDPESREFIDLANDIVVALGISYEAAEQKLLEWQADQANVRDKMREQQEEMEKAKKEGRQAMVPIWRCGVCGRADQPFIVCYVKPFIVRYEKRDLK